MQLQLTTGTLGDGAPDGFAALGGGGHLVHHVVLARVLGHPQADFLSGARFRHALVLDLHGIDPLAEVAGVAEDADRVADAQAPGLQPYCGNGKVAEIVGDGSDANFAGRRSPLGNRGGGDCRPRLRVRFPVASDSKLP